MPTIPTLTNDSFRILAAKQSYPRIKPKEIALKTSSPVEHVQEHLEGLRQAKFMDALFQH